MATLEYRLLAHPAATKEPSGRHDEQELVYELGARRKPAQHSVPALRQQQSAAELRNRHEGAPEHLQHTMTMKSSRLVPAAAMSQPAAAFEILDALGASRMRSSVQPTNVFLPRVREHTLRDTTSYVGSDTMNSEKLCGALIFVLGQHQRKNGHR